MQEYVIDFHQEVAASSTMPLDDPGGVLGVKCRVAVGGFACAFVASALGLLIELIKLSLDQICLPRRVAIWPSRCGPFV
jgi:hypothetical protein